MSGQAWLFLSTIIVGAAIGLLYDMFRIFRKTAPHAGIAVQLEDLLFWVVATVLTFYYMLHRNYGEIRPFVMLGVVIGVVLYFITISRFIVRACVAVVNYIIKVVVAAIRIILVPIKLVVGLIAPPLVKAKGSVHKNALRARRYGRGKIRKTVRNWGIFRRKV